MTAAAHSDLAPAADGLASQLRDAVNSLEWVRRQLHAAASPHSATLDEIIKSAASSPNGRDALTDPWTARWIEVAITLIDRGALALLPEGQTAAHFGKALNLLAALRLGQATVEIRFDRDGVAWLPGTGACVRGSISIAGSVAALTPAEPLETGLSNRTVTWPEITSTVVVEGADARLCEDDSFEAPSDWVDDHEAASPSDVPHSISADSAARALAARWPGRKGHRQPSPLGDAPPGELVALLAALGIPVEITPNTLTSGSIRRDSSFDHLSLLSIRAPHEFDRIAQAVTHASDRLSRRIQAHVAYIDRRYLDAAHIYAALLAECPGDTDLWRDVCWALRHAGHEELVLTWVLHPSDVVQVAEEVDWQNDGLDGHTSDSGPLDGLVRYLEWVSDAIRTR